MPFGDCPPRFYCSAECRDSAALVLLRKKLPRVTQVPDSLRGSRRDRRVLATTNGRCQWCFARTSAGRRIPACYMHRRWYICDEGSSIEAQQGCERPTSVVQKHELLSKRRARGIVQRHANRNRLRTERFQRELRTSLSRANPIQPFFGWSKASIDSFTQLCERRNELGLTS